MEIKSKEHYQNLIKQLGRRKAYEIYIASPNWKRKREARLKIDKYQCVACGKTENLHIHHKYPLGYKNIPYEDVNDDLKTFCEHCHMAIHNSINERRYQDRNIEVQNYKPTEQRELISYGLENSEIQTNGHQPPDSSQWRTCQSDEPDCKTDEIDLRETKEDRRRFRGIG